MSREPHRQTIQETNSRWRGGREWFRTHLTMERHACIADDVDVNPVARKIRLGPVDFGDPPVRGGSAAPIAGPLA